MSWMPWASCAQDRVDRELRFDRVCLPLLGVLLGSEGPQPVVVHRHSIGPEVRHAVLAQHADQGECFGAHAARLLPIRRTSAVHVLEQADRRVELDLQARLPRRSGSILIGDLAGVPTVCGRHVERDERCCDGYDDGDHLDEVGHFSRGHVET